MSPAPGWGHPGDTPAVPSAPLSPRVPRADHAGIARRDVIDQFQEKVAVTLQSYIEHQHDPGEGR